MIKVNDYLSTIGTNVKIDFNKIKQEKKFKDFLEFTINKPEIALRTSYQYILDSIIHYGFTEIEDCGEIIDKYNIFDDVFDNGANEIFGNWRALSNFVNEIRSSAMEEGKERIIMLRGPVGTAKTGLVDLVMEGVRQYSKTKEGSIFRFYWEFNPKNFSEEMKVKRTIGFGKGNIVEEQGGCASSSGCGGCSSGGGCGNDDENIIVPCQINEHPLYLLVDKQQRRTFLESVAEEYKEKHGKNLLLPKKLLQGTLCYNCNQVYESLLKKYNGDFEKVLEHIKVERYTLDADRGLVTIMPDSGQDMNQKIRMYANELSQIFPRIDFISMFGRWAAANRGIIHLSDIFKTGNTHNSLLDASEKHRINMGGVNVNFDTAIIGTTNLAEFKDVNEHGYSEALMDRTKKVDIGYVLNLNEEIKIYERDLSNLPRDKHIAPHTIELAALWAVMTRLVKPIPRDETNLTLKQIDYMNEINPLEKVEIYSGKVIQEFDHVEDYNKILIDKKFRKELVNASNVFLRNNLRQYSEGNFGVSPRRIQDLFKLILEGDKCLNPLRLIKEMDRILIEERDFFKHIELEEKLKIFAEEKGENCGNYYDSDISFKAAVNEYYKSQIAREVRFALLDLDEDELNDKIGRYVKSVENKMLKDNGKAPDEKVEDELMEYIESMIVTVSDLPGMDLEDRLNIDEEIHGLKIWARESVIRGIAAYDKIHPGHGGNRDLQKAVPFLYKMIIAGQSYELLTKLNLEKIQYGLEIMGKEPYDTFDEKVKEHIEKILGTMKNKYGYCDTCSKAITLYTFKEDLLFEGLDEDDI